MCNLKINFAVMCTFVLTKIWTFIGGEANLRVEVLSTTSIEKYTNIWMNRK